MLSLSQFPDRRFMMQFPHILLVAALMGPVAAPACADGQKLDITVTNTGTEPLICRASIAHWFSEDLGAAGAGESLSFSFGVDMATGAVFRRNDVGDEMAVQRIWCGLKGRDWPSRAEIVLARRAGEAPAPVRLNCAGAGDSTRCAAP